MLRASRKRPIRKRSFLLFELLLSLSLLLLCLLPLLKTHVRLMQEEGKEIRLLKEEQLARAKFCEMKARLYEHVPSWEELMQGVMVEGFYVKKTRLSNKTSSESGLLLRASRENYERMVYVEKALPHTH